MDAALTAWRLGLKAAVAEQPNLFDRSLLQATQERAKRVALEKVTEEVYGRHERYSEIHLYAKPKPKPKPKSNNISNKKTNHHQYDRKGMSQMTSMFSIGIGIGENNDSGLQSSLHLNEKYGLFDVGKEGNSLLLGSIS